MTELTSAILLLFAFFAVCIGVRISLESRSACRRQTIRGALSIPGFPLVGNALQVLQNPSRLFLQWAKKYGSSIFVIHLGNVAVVVVNSYQDVAALWRGHSVSLGSRPTLHTFHKVVSSVQGLTVGTTPAGESFRKKKKAISLNLSLLHVSLPHVCDYVDRNSKYVLAHLLTVNERKADKWKLLSDHDTSFLKYAQYYVLRCAILLTYGLELDTFKADNALSEDIIQTENQIIRLRSLISNYQDYLPFFHFTPIRSYYEADANFWRIKRDAYMETLNQQFEDRMLDNHLETKRSILAAISSERSCINRLTRFEAQSVCLSMVSAGLDNISLVLDHILGQFSYPKRGYAMQNRLFEELLASNDHDPIAAWKNCAYNLQCDYALAVIEEALRYFTVLPLSLPRKTTKDIHYNSIFIPEGTIVVMNAYAANHDPAVFNDPHTFLPERWLDHTTGRLDKSRPSHFSFGAGSRKCSGDILALKEMYTMLCRIVLLFKIKTPVDSSKRMILDPFEGNATPMATSFEPKQFYIRPQIRQGPKMYELKKYVLS